MFNKYINEFKMQKIDFIYKKRFQYIYIITNSIFITTKLIKTKKKNSNQVIQIKSTIHPNKIYKSTIHPNKIYKSHSKIIKST